MSENVKSDNILIYSMIAGCILSVLFSFYFFYFRQEYEFIVETACDPETQTCFYRDCGAEDAWCPPNEYEYYKVYNIAASDFKYCENEDCTQACSENLIACTENICEEADFEEGYCVAPDSYMKNTLDELEALTDRDKNEQI